MGRADRLPPGSGISLEIRHLGRMFVSSIGGISMPELVKLYIRHSAIGFALAGLFTAMLLYFNVQNLWYLVTHTDAGLLAVFLLWFMNGIVFAGVQFAWAVMNLAEPREDNDRGGTTPLIREFRPIPVRVDETRQEDRCSRQR
jgi:hypothetical protein